MLSNPQTIKKYVANPFHVASLFFTVKQLPTFTCMSLEQDQITATEQADCKKSSCYYL